MGRVCPEQVLMRSGIAESGILAVADCKKLARPIA
jgi:hypothetical protein